MQWELAQGTNAAHYIKRSHLRLFKHLSTIPPEELFMERFWAHTPEKTHNIMEELNISPDLGRA